MECATRAKAWKEIRPGSGSFFRHFAARPSAFSTFGLQSSAVQRWVPTDSNEPQSHAGLDPYGQLEESPVRLQDLAMACLERERIQVLPPESGCSTAHRPIQS